MLSVPSSLRNLAALLFACLIISISAPAFAQSKIVALVNGDPITSYELDQRSKLLKLTTRDGSRTKALDELVEEKLKLGEAKRRGISPSPQEVDSAFATIATRTKMSASQLGQALSKSGVSPGALKSRLRAELAWSRVVRARFRSTVNVQDADVIAAVRAKGEQKKFVKEFTLKQVIFIVPKGSNDATANAVKKSAERFRPTIAGCDSVLSQASGLRDVVVKNIGRRDSTQLPEELVAKLETLKISQGTEPGRIAEGFEILVLCNVREVASDIAAVDETRSEMMDQEGQLLARRYIRDLRQDAVIEYR
uniref:SurA N-terminal domain-containing protein n=1 Tax=Pararhizobium sp. IMCC3301 TaxID=3067904 RepID=UPI0027412668|nr:peptidylprolyl isomerase [Pararhizobium sp. IMCC3301]